MTKPRAALNHTLIAVMWNNCVYDCSILPLPLPHRRAVAPSGSSTSSAAGKGPKPKGHVVRRRYPRSDVWPRMT